MRPLHSALPSRALPSFIKNPRIKSPSSNVIGNIGEGLGLATFLSFALIHPDEVTRIRRQKWRQHPVARRTPDYIISLAAPRNAASLICTALQSRTPPDKGAKLSKNTALAAFPQRFPVEAKGTMRTNQGNAFWSGLWQLTEYWFTLIEVENAAPEIGYGVILCTKNIGTGSRLLDIHILAPRDRLAFTAALTDLIENRVSKQDFEQQFQSLPGAPFVEATDLV